MWSNPLILALLGATAVSTAIGVNVYLWNDEVDTPVHVAQAAQKQKPAAPEPAPKPAKPIAAKPKPSFDVVRVTPEGNAVFAGQAAPKSTVVIIDNGQFVGQLDADERGEWVFAPEKPLEPGSRQLSLEQRSKGKPAVPSDDVVVVVVPEKNKDIAGRPTKRPGQALALKFPRQGDGPSTVLQKPTPESA
ncbi:MAG: peptidoglycan-binding protein, partial [Rhodospirillaceae bacterium]|nr:peptidoglycan-binding protein [Rhodospirillaceae bacterium]